MRQKNHPPSHPPPQKNNNINKNRKGPVNLTHLIYPVNLNSYQFISDIMCFISFMKNIVSHDSSIIHNPINADLLITDIWSPSPHYLQGCLIRLEYHSAPLRNRNIQFM